MLKPSGRKQSLTGLACWSVAGVTLLMILNGCEWNSFADPSVVGAWRRTPVQLPILEQLDVIDEPPEHAVAFSAVTSEDLVPDLSEYVINAGDTLTVNIYELMAERTESIQTRKVDELGFIRLPVVDEVKAKGLTPSQLEKKIGQMLEQKGQIKNPIVSVIVVEGRARKYSIIGAPEVEGTGIGTYTIPQPDFRIMEAMAEAHGVPGRVKKLYVIRPIEPEGREVPSGAGGQPMESAGKTAPTLATPSDVVQDLVKGMDNGAAPAKPAAPAPPAPAPPGMQAGLEENNQAQTWVNVDGKWVHVPQAANRAAQARNNGQAGGYAPSASNRTPGQPNLAAGGLATGPLVTQRIIEVPYDKLVEGDLRYNVVIRPGDTISVPAPAVGFIYAYGAIARPGSYSLPGEREMTLQQLVAAAGGLSDIAIPQRVDLIRRIGDNQEVTIRVDFKAIAEGTQPDFFMKPNDELNFGTNFLATPLAVVRNGFRMSYGFGFIYDRNFAPVASAAGG